jgi:hypothetical protein
VLLYDIENKAYRCGMCGRTFTDNFLLSYLTDGGYKYHKIFDKILEENPGLKRDIETLTPAFLDFLKKIELRQLTTNEQRVLRYNIGYYLNKKNRRAQ